KATEAVISLMNMNDGNKTQCYSKCETNEVLTKPSLKDTNIHDVRTHVELVIINAVSSTLKCSEDKIEPNISFADYGVDSILGMEFINLINSKLSLSL